MSFDIGEAVGDGLFLRLLESKSVVESAGNQIGQSMEEERIFLGDFHELDSFDVKNTVQVIGVEDRESHGSQGIRKDRLGERLVVRSRAVRGKFTGAGVLS